MLRIGDMGVHGTPPHRMLKALAAISASLHEAYVDNPDVDPSILGGSCVLASLTVRDFLRRIGFSNARVNSVRLLVRAYRGDREVHSLGVGFPTDMVPTTRWPGHLVVTVPDQGYLIDTTLYGCLRPQWQDQLQAMMAVPLDQNGEATAERRKRIANVALGRGEDRFFAEWLDASENRTWRQGPDASRRHWRSAAVARMLDFYAFHTQAPRSAQGRARSPD